jgi:glycosyltransferase involved in cell wall biosynthesis
MNNKTICLNMIVKNERHVIERCLHSVKDLIDYWVIVDTGSADGTQQAIEEFLKDIPGELHERPWVDFGYNRNEALALATGNADYFLFIDADDRLVFSETFRMPDLQKDLYLVQQRIVKANKYGFSNNYIVLLARDVDDIQWEGVLHESIICGKEKSQEFLKGVISEYHQDGSRSCDPQSLQKDIEILERMHQEGSESSRHVFYLAQTYRASGNHRKALEYFQKRASMGGREDEVFYSLVCLGILQKTLNECPARFVWSFCKAYQFRPFRIEPLYELIRHLIEVENYLLGSLIAEFAITIPLPTDLFVDEWIYEWGVLLQLYICSRGARRYARAHEIAEKLFAISCFPKEYRLQIENDKN